MVEMMKKAPDHDQEIAALKVREAKALAWLKNSDECLFYHSDVVHQAAYEELNYCRYRLEDLLYGR